MKKILSMALSFMLITIPIIAFAEAPVLPNEEENILNSSAATKDFIREVDYYENEDGNLVFEKVENLGDYTPREINSEDVEYYKKDVLMLVPTDEVSLSELKESVRMVKETNHNARVGVDDETWDSTDAVKIFLRIEYSLHTSSLPMFEGEKFKKFDKVSGSYSTPKDGISVTNQNVKYYILGIGIDSYSMEDNREFNPTAQSWSKTPPSSWKAIAVNGAQSILSANYEVTLKRGSTWKVDLNVSC